MTSRQIAWHRPIILIPMVLYLSALRFQADLQNQLVHTIKDFLRALCTFGTHISEMLTLAIFDCDADELIIDPALRAKWHIDLISAHEVIGNGISAGIIAAFVKADRFIFERTAATNSANGQIDHLLGLAVPFFTESAILFFLLGLPLERFLLFIRTILSSQRKAGRDLLQNECSNEVRETLAVAFFRIKECGDMLITDSKPFRLLEQFLLQNIV